MAQMSSWERVEAALAGADLDHPPVSMWRHFPKRDQTAEAIADAMLTWQAHYDFDFIKMMPPGDYPTIDWGAESEYQGSPDGTRETTRYPVVTVDDWSRIVPVPVDRDRNREVIEAARLVNERVRGEVPVLQTVFSPLTVAMKLSAGKVLDHLRQRPDIVHTALAVITEVTRALTSATLERGATGIFFASQCATTNLVSAHEYREFGTRYDLQVLKAATASRFTLLHIHGENILFDDLEGYPVHALNWHDRRTSPSLAEGQDASGHCVVGGINEREIVTMIPDEAAAEARDAVASLDGRFVMIAPGCVMPIATPEENVTAVSRAMRNRS